MNTSSAKPLSCHLAICSRDADMLSQKLLEMSTQGAISFSLSQAATTAEKIDPLEVNVLLADPDLAAKLVDKTPNLMWLQSTWAGNAPLLKCANQDYILTVAKGVFDKQIREFVFTYLLAHVRQVLEIEALNADMWQSVMPSYLSGRTLGVLGTGSLAKALIPVANAFNVSLIGLSRSGKSVKGFEHVYSLGGKLELARKADFIINLLPDTPETLHVVDEAFLSKMKKGSLLINAGRGNAIDEAALLKSLNNEQPAKAVLDVFNHEPLPKSHVFWSHPQVLITHHTAAITDLTDIANLFFENYQRFTSGKSLYNKFNWKRGY